MLRNLNKLQIRVEILNAVKTLESGDKHTQSFLDEVLSPLKEISDIDSVLDILLKEIISATNDNRFFVLSFLLENLVPKEKLETELWQILNKSYVSDTVKASVINILRDLGNQINYEKYTEYFENPDSIIDSDTEKMLQRAINNPEALIDFLDFMEALPEKDRGLLIDSLCEDFNGDELANLFTPVIYSTPNSELCKYAIKKLGDSKSTLALRPIHFILERTNNEEILALAKKSLTALKLAGAREDSTDEFYRKAFGNSKIKNAHISMPDGRGNVGIIISREKLEENSVQMFAVVLNDTYGIIDCFGFNDITESELTRIITRFYSGQEKISLNPSVAKLLLENAEKLALDTIGKIPYEYACWKRIIADVLLPEDNINTVLEKNLEKKNTTLNDLKLIYETSILDKWFLINNDNEEFNKLLTSIVETLKVNQNIDTIDELCQNAFKSIWTYEITEKINFRLLLSAYLLKIQNFNTHATILNSIRYTPEVKNELLMNIIRVSVYEFLLREKEKHQNPIKSTNIFSRRNEANKTLIEKKVLDSVLSDYEKKWSV